MTLPERTLCALAAVDADRARAVVKLVDSATAAGGRQVRPVEVVEVAPGAAVIVVGPSRALHRIPWLRLAEVAPGRYLLTIVPGTAVESLEVAILDLLESLPAHESRERAVLEALRELITESRRQQRITKFEMLYVRSPAARRRHASGR